MPRFALLPLLAVIACSRTRSPVVADASAAPDGNRTPADATSPLLVDAGAHGVSRDGSVDLSTDAAPPGVDHAGPIALPSERMEISAIGPDRKFSYPYPLFCHLQTSRAVEKVVLSALRAKENAFMTDLAEAPNCASPGMCSFDLDCKLHYASERAVSVLCEGLSYLGGAHPTKHAFGITVAIAGHDARRVTLDSLFASPTKARAKLPELATAAMSTETDAFEGAFKHPDFVLEPSGLRVIDADVPFAIGPQQVLIPWSDLDELRPRGILATIREDAGAGGRGPNGCDRDRPLDATELDLCARQLHSLAERPHQEGVGYVGMDEACRDAAATLRRGERPKLPPDMADAIARMLHDETARAVSTACERALWQLVR